MSGRAARIRSITLRYSSAVCLRFIALRIRLLPDCTGKCKYGISLSHVPCASIRSSVMSLGCEVVKRMRSKPSILSSCQISCASDVSKPSSAAPWYAFTFWPSNVISRTPRSTRSRASVTMRDAGRLTSAPRVYGTTQNAQNLSQPSWTVRNAVGPRLALGRDLRWSNLSSSGKSVSSAFRPV